MTKHIFNTFRKFLISTALKIMPLQAAEPQAHEPIRSGIDPKTERWLFDQPRSLPAQMSDLTKEMSELSGSLSRLHGLVSMISGSAPEAGLASSPALIGGVVWSDAMLFDGEPEATASDNTGLSGVSDLLFDSTENEIRHTIDSVILSNLASSAAQAVSAS